MWEPRRLTTLWAFVAPYRDSYEVVERILYTSLAFLTGGNFVTLMKNMSVHIGVHHVLGFWNGIPELYFRKNFNRMDSVSMQLYTLERFAFSERPVTIQWLWIMISIETYKRSRISHLSDLERWNVFWHYEVEFHAVELWLRSPLWISAGL
jgi:hypothetical protein